MEGTRQENTPDKGEVGNRSRKQRKYEYINSCSHPSVSVFLPHRLEDCHMTFVSRTWAALK